jgi:hypothetical protein
MLNLDPKMFEAMKGHVPAMAAGAQASTNPLQGLQMPTQGASNPLPAPQPKAASPNPLGEVFSSFARGFAPQQTQAVDERRKAEAQERGKKALTWMQHTAQQPANQRAAFTLQNAQDIARETGQPYEAVIASAKDPNAFSDEKVNGAIAKFSAQLGISPATPEPPRFQGMGLGDGGVGVLNQATGQMELVREPTPKPEAPVKWEQFTDADGQVWDVNPYTRERVKAEGMRGRVPGEGGGGISADLAYRMGRDQLKDAQEAEAAETKARNATSSLDEGIGLVNQLVSHPGFKTIYGLQGALPVFPGTEGADALAMLEQIGGQAFLAGVETMRGTGPLSDNEGKKVAAARTRLLNRGQSPEAAAKAAQEFTASMQRLLAAYQKESGGATQPTSDPADEDDDDFIDTLFGSNARFIEMGPPPPGVSPEMWAVMDDEDRAAFQ